MDWNTYLKCKEQVDKFKKEQHKRGSVPNFSDVSHKYNLFKCTTEANMKIEKDYTSLEMKDLNIQNISWVQK